MLLLCLDIQTSAIVLSVAEVQLGGLEQAEEVENAEAMAEDGLASAGKAPRLAAMPTAEATGLSLQCQQQELCARCQLSDVIASVINFSCIQHLPLKSCWSSID